MEFCPSGDLHALRQRQPGKYFSEHAVSCMLFNIDGHQVPQHIMMEVGDTYKRILAETAKVRDEHPDDMPILQAISIVLNRHPELRQQELVHEVLQWYICRMEAWFAFDAIIIPLKTWDQARRYLTMLPMEPILGKMLILGSILNCLDPILIVVAGLSVRDPFLTPLDKKDDDLTDIEKEDIDRAIALSLSEDDHKGKKVVGKIYAFAPW
ncbi:hypothetical protein JHK87_018921 [Glycine soja]|nr:hypothetical protein JHK87_018921 [Glycine soja]